MEELDAIGIAAVFAADTQFQVGIGLTAVLRRHTHQLADAVAVDGLERVDGKYLDFSLDAWLCQPLDVLEQEFALGIVTAEAKGCLRQVVGAEAEELRDGGDLIRGQCCARQFDHRAEFVGDGGVTLLASNLFGRGLQLAANLFQLVDMSNQRDHDLGLQFLPFSGHFEGRLEDGTRLHDVDLGEEQSQAAAAQAEHGVHFAHGTDLIEQLAFLFEFPGIFSTGLQARYLDQQFFVRGQELVQGRVDEADDDGVAFARLRIDHGLEDAFEVAALVGEQLIKGCLSLFLALGENHLLHNRQALLLHEHMLGAAEADTLGAEGDRAFGIAGIVGIGPDAEPAVLVGPTEQFLQIGLVLVVGFDGLDDAREDFACGTVDRNVVAFAQDEIGVNDVEEMLRLVDADTLAAAPPR